MRYAIRNLAALACVATLASCGSFGGKSQSSAPASASSPARQVVSDEPVKIGAPFTVGSVTYTPQDVPAYDEVGYASYYGAELSGQATANGENFNPMGASAAHKTLPLPSYVEVTALDTGRTILVRVNDRGPFANDRLIDLSEGAARQLGITAQGVAGVRVRRVNPPEQERAVLREGMTAAERIETPEPLLKVLRDKLSKQPKPSAIVQKSAAGPVPAKAAPVSSGPAPVSEGRFIRESGTAARAPKPAPTAQRQSATSGGYVVQVAAFSSKSRADALARQIGAWVSTSSDGRLFRVRFGPYTSEADAQRGLATARQKGHSQARIYRD